MNKAFSLDGRGREEEAVPYYLQALRAGLGGEDYKDALIGLASSYRNIGRLKAAKRTIEKARRTFPDDPVAEAFYALILHDRGEHARALKVLGRAFVKSSSEEMLGGYRQALSRKFNALTRRRR